MNQQVTDSFLTRTFGFSRSCPTFRREALAPQYPFPEGIQNLNAPQVEKTGC
jgi:hypothetical protein